MCPAQHSGTDVGMDVDVDVEVDVDVDVEADVDVQARACRTSAVGKGVRLLSLISRS